MKSLLFTVFFFCCYQLTAQLSEDTLYSLSGIIGKTIKAKINLETTDGLIFGTIRYKSNIPIMLRGESDDKGSYRLPEFDKTGTITGIINGRISNNQLNGTWFSPKTRKEYKIVMKLHARTIKQKIGKKPSIEGEYSFAYGKDGPASWLKVSDNRNDSVQIALNGNTGSPAFNLADVEAIRVPLTNGTIKYVLDGECIIKIRFVKDIAHIKYDDGHSSCGFGHNATVEGIYLRMK